MILDNHFNAWPKTVKFQQYMINGWNQVILFHYNVSAEPLSLPLHGNGRHRLSFGRNNTREITQYMYILHKYLSIITPLWIASSMLIIRRSEIFTMIWIKLVTIFAENICENVLLYAFEKLSDIEFYLSTYFLSDEIDNSTTFPFSKITYTFVD